MPKKLGPRFTEDDLSTLAELCRIAAADLRHVADLAESRLPLNRKIEDFRIWADKADALIERIEA